MLQAACSSIGKSATGDHRAGPWKARSTPHFSHCAVRLTLRHDERSLQLTYKTGNPHPWTTEPLLCVTNAPAYPSGNAGDVLLHTVTDAILGALCMPDIGESWGYVGRAVPGLPLRHAGVTSTSSTISKKLMTTHFTPTPPAEASGMHISHSVTFPLSFDACARTVSPQIINSFAVQGTCSRVCTHPTHTF